jgi:hypothetical protein
MEMTGNLTTSQVDALMYVVPTMAENHVPYGELFGTTDSTML